MMYSIYESSSTNTNDWDLVNRGNIILGGGSHFYNREMLTGCNEYIDKKPKNAYCNTRVAKNVSNVNPYNNPGLKFVANEGVMSGGRNFVFCGSNGGVITAGDTTNFNGFNNGVLVFGRLIKGQHHTCEVYKNINGENNNDQTFIVNPNIIGAGLTLCGTVLECTNNSVPGNPIGIYESGFIQGSTFKELPIELKGYFKLTSDFHLLGENGEEMNLANTISAMQAKISQLESELTKTKIVSTIAEDV